VVAAIVGVLVLGAGATVFSLAWVGASSVRTVDIGGRDRSGDQEPSRDEEPVLEEVHGVTNVLLVGSDSRQGLTDEDLLRLGTDNEDERTGLTDTLMLVQLDAEEERASILSFPRDLLVTHCDGTKGRINAAYEYGEQLRPGGGARCLVETVKNLTGVPVHHYVQVDFQGFIKAVDAIGGVDFYVDEPLVDERAGLNVQPGCVHFDGAKALGFVRARYLDPAADFGRIARQQRFLREMVAKAASLEVLANPGRVLGLVRSVGGALTVDPGLSSPLDQANLAYTFRELSNDGIDMHVAPGYDDTWNGANVLALDEQAARPLFAQFQRGSFDGPGDAGQPPPASPSSEAEELEVAVGPPAPDAPSVVAPQPDPSPSPSFKGAAVSDVEC
jgi:LCP family protein required for cell wall assembly